MEVSVPSARFSHWQYENRLTEMCMEKLVELLMEDFVAKLSWCSRREGISVAEFIIASELLHI